MLSGSKRHRINHGCLGENELSVRLMFGDIANLAQGVKVHIRSITREWFNLWSVCLCSRHSWDTTQMCMKFQINHTNSWTVSYFSLCWGISSKRSLACMNKTSKEAKKCNGIVLAISGFSPAEIPRVYFAMQMCVQNRGTTSAFLLCNCQCCWSVSATCQWRACINRGVHIPF